MRRLQVGGYRVDVLAMLGPVADYAASLPAIREVTYAPLLDEGLRGIAALWRLRKRNYDMCVLPFPATRWQYAAVARFIGAKRTVTHRYGGLSSFICATVRTKQVPLSGGHRLWENERLGDAVSLPHTKETAYVLPEAWRRPRISGLLGVHPGTMVYKGNEARRWPFEHFVQLITSQLDRGRVVRVFFGPNERPEEARLRASVVDPRLETVALSLAAAAQSLAECEVFVGNDAGFAHLASGLGVKTVVLFGMTNPVRALPVGEALALRPSECPPCHDEGLRGFACVRNIGYRCLTRDLTVSAADAAVERAFESSKITQQLERAGPFRLYGRDRTPE